MHFVLLENIFKWRGFFFFPFISVRCFLREDFEEVQHTPESFVLKVENYPHGLIPPLSQSPLK